MTKSEKKEKDKKKYKVSVESVQIVNKKNSFLERVFDIFSEACYFVAIVIF